MSLPGEVRVVDDVPRRSPTLVTADAPRSIALSGGDTARHLLRAARDRGRRRLVATSTVFSATSGGCPSHDPDSNEGMARARLPRRGRSPPRSTRCATPAPTIEAAATAYDAARARVAARSTSSTSASGPTATPLRCSPARRRSTRPSASSCATGDDLHPHPRLTFTYPALATSRLVVFTVAGADKRDAFARVRAGEDLPAARVRAEQVVWLVDRAAAGLGLACRHMPSRPRGR